MMKRTIAFREQRKKTGPAAAAGPVFTISLFLQQISDLGEKNDVSGRLRLGFGLRLLLFLEFVECLDDA